MGLFSMFKKKEEIQDLSKKYLSTGDKRFDEKDMLKRKDVYEIFKKYQGYEQTINLDDSREVSKKVSSMMSELFGIKIFCKNYNEYLNIFEPFDETIIDRIDNLNILECMALTTYIQRQHYLSGGYDSFYLNCTTSGLISKIINRIISMYESREN